eukprot:5774617-Alexandrium_andersonii.AAC.1
MRSLTWGKGRTGSGPPCKRSTWAGGKPRALQLATAGRACARPLPPYPKKGSCAVAAAPCSPMEDGRRAG